MRNNSLYNSKLLEESYYPRVVAYYFREWKSFNMPFHRHDQVEIMYVIKGKCTIETCGAKYAMSKGDCILLDADTTHNLIVEEGKPCKMLNVEFVFEKGDGNLHPIKDLINGTDSFRALHNFRAPYLIVKDNEEIHELLKGLIKELDGRNTDSRYIVELLLSQIFVTIGRRLEEIRSDESGTGSFYVRKAMLYIHRNFGSSIHVEDIASHVNLHPNYLHRIFKAHAGVTIMEYLQAIRVEKAEMLLIYTDIPIIDIAGEVGFGSRQYFSFTFKSAKGMSPAEYRKAFNRVYGHQ
jgi:AraC family transcriptional regulator, melibiose operon regulatory protein